MPWGCSEFPLGCSICIARMLPQCCNDASRINDEWQFFQYLFENNTNENVDWIRYCLLHISEKSAIGNAPTFDQRSYQHYSGIKL